MYRGRDYFFEERSVDECLEFLSEQKNLEVTEYFRPGRSWLRELYCIQRAAYLLNCKMVAISEKDPPDGYIVMGGQRLMIEVKEAMWPGRRRVDEIVAVKQKILQEVDSCKLWRNAEDWMEIVKKIICKAADSNKYRYFVLLIYVSEWPDGIEGDRLEEMIIYSYDDLSRDFESLMVLGGSRLIFQKQVFTPKDGGHV